MGESSSECGREASHVASSSGIDSLSRQGRNLALVGDDGGLMKGSSAKLLTSRMNTQLRVLRGEPGVRGEGHPSVLTVFVGDRGGVA